MPIYAYRCECGATVEILERMGEVSSVCGEDCRRLASATNKLPKRPQADASPAVQSAVELAKPEPGQGKLKRILSCSMIRGDGREAKEKVFNPVAQANRPGCEDCAADYDL